MRHPAHLPVKSGFGKFPTGGVVAGKLPKFPFLRQVELHGANVHSQILWSTQSAYAETQILGSTFPLRYVC